MVEADLRSLQPRREVRGLYSSPPWRSLLVKSITIDPEAVDAEDVKTLRDMTAKAERDPGSLARVTGHLEQSLRGSMDVAVHLFVSPCG
jgi:hypothetical protein